MAQIGQQPDEPYSAAVRANRAVLILDVVESVRHVEQDETAFVSRWLAFVEHVRTEILPEFNGHFTKGLGDGMLLDFDDARSAVSAAFAIQQASHRGNAGLPPAQQVMLRMGVEISDVIVDHADLYGRGVSRAARLLTLAGPGEIVISANLRDQLTADLDADIEDLGECYLKHVPQPVRTYRIGPPGPRPVIEPGVFVDDLRPTLAVVPFTTDDAGDEHHVLGEVLAEELIQDLSRSPELHVISRLSTTVFRGRDTPLAQISANLNADYVLSGEYRVTDRFVAIEAELMEAKSGQTAWAGRCKGQIAAVLSGKRELIDEIAINVSAAVMVSELQRAQSQALPTLKSYTLLIAAVALMHRLSSIDFDQARRLLETLIERAPRQAVPRAWLAKWHVLRVQQGWSEDPQQDARYALQCTKQALDIDPHCSLALSVDGFVHTNLLKELDTAKARYDLALLTNPNDSLAWLLLGTLHAFKGEGTPAVSCTQRALRLSPLDPHRYFYDSLSATAHLAAHQYERALKLAQRSLRANCTHTSTLRAMAIAQWHLGRHEDARRTVRKLLQMEPQLTIRRWRERSPSAGYRIGDEWAATLRNAGVPE
ncbi:MULTISPECIES: adenylate/guanylate cyclase domain-containing protein [Microvirga]|uniref:adenylate/guanylate cyclase domain-containing protein n=1 Tax=Microvirga TaxID=186650 RepID=UPI001CFFDC2E|nr:adenylate/guanylate cyclase domain-containing protein [Microvirga lenta]MCB5175246.1 adenylate/guanylate cyclase domain-containing protein [Microvirga lenta]